MARAVTKGRGDPEEGVYAKLVSRPAKESYCHQPMSKVVRWNDGLLYFSSSGWHRLSS